MNLWRASFALIALICALALGGPALGQAPRPLSDADREAYASAFLSVRRGDFTQALERVAGVRDRSLLGHLQFEILFHRDYPASYDELRAWLELYSDHPQAMRVHALALRRRPADAPMPPEPAEAQRLRSWIEANGGEMPGPRAAREALNAGDLTRARELAAVMDEAWVGALAAYRQNDMAAAQAGFETVALDPTEDVWVRAGGAYWAARAALRAGREQEAPPLLRLAARWPQTFYGQVALRHLGVEPVIEGVALPEGAIAFVPDPDDPYDLARVASLVLADPRAHRAAALAQLNRRGDATAELRAGLHAATDADNRQSWRQLAAALGPQLGLNGVGRIDPADFPRPELAPLGGFNFEPGLLYALIRKESRFDPRARSSAGAYGLMQVMPATAAELADQPILRREPELLFDPALNMRMGQNYLQYVLAMGPIGGDLLRAVAAYNGGPGPIYDAVRMLGQDTDALLMIESIPVPQSRQYVEEVMAAYWIYQRLLGRPLATLDAVVAGASIVPPSLDRLPEPAPVETAVAPATAPTS